MVSSSNNLGPWNPRLRSPTHQDSHSLPPLRTHELPSAKEDLRWLRLPRYSPSQVRLVPEDPAKKGHRNRQDALPKNHPSHLQEQAQECCLIDLFKRPFNTRQIGIGEANHHLRSWEHRYFSTSSSLFMPG